MSFLHERGGSWILPPHISRVFKDFAAHLKKIPRHPGFVLLGTQVENHWPRAYTNKRLSKTFKRKIKQILKIDIFHMNLSSSN